MNRPLTAYLLLERLAMEADEDEVSFAEFIREQLDAFWDVLSDDDRARLQARRGTTIDDLNPTQIEERDGVIHARLRAWEPSVSARALAGAQAHPEASQFLNQLGLRTVTTNADSYRIGVASNDNGYRALGAPIVRH